jgi:molecular chaperone GrpE (heat shock protein)
MLFCFMILWHVCIQTRNREKRATARQARANKGLEDFMLCLLKFYDTFNRCIVLAKESKKSEGKVKFVNGEEWVDKFSYTQS